MREVSAAMHKHIADVLKRPEIRSSNIMQRKDISQINMKGFFQA